MLTVILCICLGLCASAVGDDQYIYFDFVRQWGPNCCYQSHCREIPKEIRSWTIHGLWPSYNASSYPFDCEGKSCRFDESAVTDLLPQLDVEWPSDQKGGDVSFWTHEYCKHGTCCKDILPKEHDYFSHALALHHKLDIGAVLASANMTPDLHQSYSFEQLGAALAEGLGTKYATYWCRFVKESGMSKQLITQISVCVDKELIVRNCPESRGHACHPEEPFYLLPWDILNSNKL